MLERPSGREALASAGEGSTGWRRPVVLLTELVEAIERFEVPAPTNTLR